MYIINCSLSEAMDFYQENVQFDMTISFANYEYKDMDESVVVPGSHAFYFNDTVYDRNYGPNEDHMKRLQNLYDELNIYLSTKVLIHCFAGVSRSSAATLMFMLHHNLFASDKQTVEKLFEINVNANPNNWMIEWISKEYDKENLIEIVNKAKSERFTRNLTVPV